MKINIAITFINAQIKRSHQIRQACEVERQCEREKNNCSNKIGIYGRLNRATGEAISVNYVLYYTTNQEIKED